MEGYGYFAKVKPLARSDGTTYPKLPKALIIESIIDWSASLLDRLFESSPFEHVAALAGDQFFQGRRSVGRGFPGEISSDLRERFMPPANLSVARRLIIKKHTMHPPPPLALPNKRI